MFQIKTTASLTLLILGGCSPAAQTQRKTDPPEPKSQRPGLHRFVLTRAGVDVAFDTQTGQICRTWEWAPTGPAPKPASDFPRQRESGEFAPTCLSLYQTFPSGVGTELPAAPDPQQ